MCEVKDWLQLIAFASSLCQFILIFSNLFESSFILVHSMSEVWCDIFGFGSASSILSFVMVFCLLFFVNRMILFKILLLLLLINFSSLSRTAFLIIWVISFPAKLLYRFTSFERHLLKINIQHNAATNKETRFMFFKLFIFDRNFLTISFHVLLSK